MPRLNDAEIELLLATARVRLIDMVRVRGALARVSDWTVLIQSALRHRTAALLCHHLLALASDALPADIRSAATEFLAACKGTNQAGREQLLAILCAFDDAQIPALPFKGPVLAQQAYGNPTLRGFGDLDILIHEDDIDGAMTLLAGLGYRSTKSDLKTRHKRAFYHYNGQDILFADGRLPVEPHWAFAQRTLNLDLDVEGMWARAEVLTLDSAPVRVLSPEDTLPVLALHGTKERWQQLSWIVDVAEFLRQHPALDWDAILNQATRQGHQRMLLLATAVAHQLLQAPVPDPVRRLAAADATCRKLAAQVTDNLFDPAAETLSVFALSVFHRRVHERFSDRLLYVGRTVTTPKIQHFRMIDLPDSLFFGYRILKPAHDYVALPIWLAGKALFGPWRSRDAG